MIVRPAQIVDSEVIARIQVDTWRSAYRNILDAAYLKNLSYGEKAKRWQETIASLSPDRRVLLAQVDDGPVAGFAASGPLRAPDPEFSAEIYALYVLDAYQGQGIGKSLFWAATQHLSDQGLRSLLVWALTDNPFAGFYQAMGGQAVRHRVIEIGGCSLKETGYGWHVPMRHGD